LYTLSSDGYIFLLESCHDYGINRSGGLGATVFVGLGAYTYISGHSQIRDLQAKGHVRLLPARRAGITGMAITFIGLGVYRMIN
jgi:hypothetical protein